MVCGEGGIDEKELLAKYLIRHQFMQLSVAHRAIEVARNQLASLDLLIRTRAAEV